MSNEYSSYNKVPYQLINDYLNKSTSIINLGKVIEVNADKTIDVVLLAVEKTNDNKLLEQVIIPNVTISNSAIGGFIVRAEAKVNDIVLLLSPKFPEESNVYNIDNNIAYDYENSIAIPYKSTENFILSIDNDGFIEYTKGNAKLFNDLYNIDLQLKEALQKMLNDTLVVAGAVASFSPATILEVTQIIQNTNILLEELKANFIK